MINCYYIKLFSVGLSFMFILLLFRKSLFDFDTIDVIDSHKLPFCQRSDHFITFKDLSGAGLLHKVDDFLDAARIAILTSRTLIDYVPGLAKKHMRDKYNRPVDLTGNAFGFNFVHGWGWSNIADVSRMAYTLKFKNGSTLKCRLRIIGGNSVDELKGNILSIDYGTPDMTFFRIENIQSHKKITKVFNLKGVKAQFSGKPFSNFIQLTGNRIKKKCFERAKIIARYHNRSSSLIRRFLTIHLRGTDRPCALKKLSPQDLISRLINLGVNRLHDVVYLMSDLDHNNIHLKSIKNFFRDFYLFEAKDMDVYDREVFARHAPFLIYATEIHLQQVADGVIESYRGHSMAKNAHILGYLEPWRCLSRKIYDKAYKKIKTYSRLWLRKVK